MLEMDIYPLRLSNGSRDQRNLDRACSRRFYVAKYYVAHPVLLAPDCLIESENPIQNTQVLNTLPDGLLMQSQDDDCSLLYPCFETTPQFW